VGLEAAFHRDDGTTNVPGQDTSWDEWVAASKTRNWCNDDPLLDWLTLYGEARGFVPDDKRPGFDPRTDFREFIFRKGREFESRVVAYLAERHQLVTICQERGDVRNRARVEATWRAMNDEVEVIAQGVLWNAETSTYGAPDLLVRSDVLQALFPDCVPSHGPRHYLVVDIKFKTLDLLKDGSAGAELCDYRAQVWIYNEALGRMQGFTPEAGYLLGRRWEDSRGRGQAAFERLARIDRVPTRANDEDIAILTADACDWIRRVRTDGASWQVLPEPSVPELRPNMRAKDDAPWHRAKAEIAAALEDLTLLPRVNLDGRSAAIANGLSRWTDARCCASSLGVTGASYAATVDAVIAANHSAPDGPLVFPARVTVNEPLWRDPVVPEFFVDFETVSDLDEDFAAFPDAGGQALIFMIGCGRITGPPDDLFSWDFRVFTVRSLEPAEELRIIEEWLAYMKTVCDAHGQPMAAARAFHWSPAEQSFLTAAYNAAHKRHGEPPWPTVPWIDLLKHVVRAEPVTVRGAFSFGLKAIARALHAHKLIDTNWSDSATDGLGAMVGAWACHHEARSRGVAMSDVDLMKEIEAYNEVDCKVMAEVVGYLRRER
jgi:hypothetical protein